MSDFCSFVVITLWGSPTGREIYHNFTNCSSFNRCLESIVADLTVPLHLHPLQSAHLVQININAVTPGAGRRGRTARLSSTLPRRDSHSPSTGQTARTQPPLSWSCRTTQSTRNSGIRTHSHIPPPSVGASRQKKEQPRRRQCPLTSPDSAPKGRRGEGWKDERHF